MILAFQRDVFFMLYNGIHLISRKISSFFLFELNSDIACNENGNEKVIASDGYGGVGKRKWNL